MTELSADPGTDPAVDGMTTLRWQVDGIELVGDLRRPSPAPGTGMPAGPAGAGRPAAGPSAAGRPGTGLPAVVVTGPFTGVKEQVAGEYARRLTAAGYVTLAVDHRGFGASGGRRGHEDPQGKLADLRSAVDLLTRTDGVDAGRIGVLGVCLGGGYALRAAASDPRVRAVAGVAGGYNSPAAFAAQLGVENYRATLAGLLAGYDDVLPAVAPDGGEAAMGGDEPWAYYGTDRSAAPGSGWENRVTRGSLYHLMTFDALGAADLLGATPLLVVHGRVDAYCSPALASAVHERATGPKEIVWLDAEQHIDLYDVDRFVTPAADAVAAHFATHL